jgi:hypothetical protein
MQMQTKEWPWTTAAAAGWLITKKEARKNGSNWNNW